MTFHRYNNDVVSLPIRYIASREVTTFKEWFITINTIIWSLSCKNTFVQSNGTPLSEWFTTDTTRIYCLFFMNIFVHNYIISDFLERRVWCRYHSRKISPLLSRVRRKLILQLSHCFSLSFPLKSQFKYSTSFPSHTSFLTKYFCCCISDQR